MGNSIWLVAVASLVSGLVGAWAFTQMTEPLAVAPEPVRS